jgi:PKD domain
MYSPTAVRCLGTKTAVRFKSVVLCSLLAIAGCSDGGHRSASPTAATANPEGAAPIAGDLTGGRRPSGGSRNVARDVTFPPRNEPFAFRQQLEAQYRDVLRRSATSSFVDIEGTIVWTQEYLRYRVNGCGHEDAVSRVSTQIQGGGIQPICIDFTGTTVQFPPRNEPFAFRTELERIYRDSLRRSTVQTFVDTEGDIVWTQEYLRYRVNGCSHVEATDRVLAQVVGGAVQPVCGPGGGPPPPVGGPSIMGFISGVSSGPVPGTLQGGRRPDAGAGPVLNVSGSGTLTPGSSNQVTLNASQAVNAVVVSVETDTSNSMLNRPFVVAEAYYQLSFPSPQTTVPLTISVPGSAAGSRFTIEYAAAGPNGVFGPYSSQGVQVDSPPASCAYALIPNANSVGAGGGTFSFTVSTAPGCGWRLSSNAAFVSLSASVGTGAASPSYVVAANTGPGRTARITLTGDTGGSAIHDITQAGTTCSYTVSPTTLNVVGSATTASVNVSTSAGCPWTAASLSSFISLESGSPGSGSGTAVFSVQANPGAARSGTVRVSFPTGSPQDVTINQATAAAAPRAIILNPSTCPVNTVCNFNGATSQGQITEWNWDFGDGTTGQGAMVAHVYPTSFIPPSSSRVVTVTLTVVGPGGSNSATTTVNVTRSY